MNEAKRLEQPLSQSHRFDVLAGGEIRIIENGCAFLFKRLKPGLIFTAIADCGARTFGTAALDQIKSEYDRFGQKISWFIDAGSAPESVADFEEWANWLAVNQGMFSAIHIYSGSKNLQLSVAIASHIASTKSLITVHTEYDAFAEALADATDRACIIADWIDAAAVLVRQSMNAREVFTFENENCSFSFDNLERNVFLSIIRGKDDGSLGNYTFDYFRKQLADCSKPATWFVDASAVEYVGVDIPEAWSCWISNNHRFLERVVMLTPPGALPILINVEKVRSIDKNRILLCRDCEQFDAAIRSRLVSRC